MNGSRKQQRPQGECSGASFVARTMQDFPRKMDNFYNNMKQEQTRQDDTMHSSGKLDDFIQTDEFGNRNLQLEFNMCNFNREDVDVRAAGRFLVVTAWRSKNVDGTVVTDEYKRCYELPVFVDTDMLSTSMTNEGILSVEAPAMPGGEMIGQQQTAATLGYQASRQNEMPQTSQMRNVPVQQLATYTNRHTDVSSVPYQNYKEAHRPVPIHGYNQDNMYVQNQFVQNGQSSRNVKDIPVSHYFSQEQITKETRQYH